VSKLTSKHLKALQLLDANQHSMTEIAKSVGMNTDYLGDLMSGSDKAGPIGVLFHAEYSKIKKKVEDRTTQKVNQTRDLLVTKLMKWAQDLTSSGEMSISHHRMMVDSINALSRAVPLVNIESNSWQTNLTGVDIVSEFKRLKAMAKASTVRERVSEPSAGGTGEIPLSGETSDSDGESLQDPKVQAKPKTKRFSL